MCDQDCRTWLWGGTGHPDLGYNGEGRCSCICDNERWSNHNILGRPSCVPVVAHMILGWGGLVLSMVALCHGAYQLKRQVSYDARYDTSSAHLLAQSFSATWTRSFEYHTTIPRFLGSNEHYILYPVIKDTFKLSVNICCYCAVDSIGRTFACHLRDTSVAGLGLLEAAHVKSSKLTRCRPYRSAEPSHRQMESLCSTHQVPYSSVLVLRTYVCQENK